MNVPKGFTAVKVFKTDKEKEVGLKMYGDKAVPPDVVFVFPHIGPLVNVTTHGMHERIRIYGLRGEEEGFSPLVTYEMDPNSMIGLDERSRHFVETSAKAPVITDFRFLAPYVK